EQRVEWLLISGQATILYGAATFSEDVDLWVKPTFTDEELAWIRDNMFSLTEFVRWITDYPSAERVLAPESVLQRAAEQLRQQGDLSPRLEDELDDWFEQRMAPLRKADRSFWRPVIDELRVLRQNGQLMTLGAPV